jgi:2,3-dihydroxybenzoate decarboxylase
MTRPSRVIALEEHFTTTDFPANKLAALYDIGEQRIASMDRHGIDVQVISLAAPGVQGEPQVATAIEKAQRTNDTIAAVTHRYPTRFAGFACLPTQDPIAAADELERGVRQLGLKGALINGHTHGHYLDEEAFYPLWERAEALDVPLYLHPAPAHKPWDLVAGYPELAMAAWGWSAETGAHALRIVVGGVFDRFPGARMILGHMGETIPFYLSRIDSRMHDKLAQRGLKKRKPSEYIRQNIVITTSGVFDDNALTCAIKALGLPSVMFSVDYPYENDANASTWLASLPFTPSEVAAIAHGNAERILRL